MADRPNWKEFAKSCKKEYESYKWWQFAKKKDAYKRYLLFLNARYKYCGIR